MFLAPEGVFNITCPSTDSLNTLEVVWSPPTNQPVLSYLVEVREYVFVNNIILTVIQRESEVLHTSLTVNEVGESLLLILFISEHGQQY